MLHLHVDPPAGIRAKRYLQDDDRRLIFTYLGTLNRGHIDAFELNWNSQSIPFTARSERRSRGDGTSYLLYSTPQIDGMAVSELRSDDTTADLSAGDAEIAVCLAIECILAFGQSYDGLSAPDGAYEVETAAGHVRLSNFGYRTFTNSALLPSMEGTTTTLTERP